MGHEFNLIEKYFRHIGPSNTSDILLGIGDDTALVSCSKESLAITVDTLVSGVHCFADDPPESFAHKALMVNLSDLSAMGATPFAFLLSITMPETNETWLKIFSETLNTLASKYHVQLIGGDTTAGPLSVSITALGSVQPSKALKRSNAKVGDDIYVTGELGLSAFYVYARANNVESSEKALQAYRYPQPPILLGPKLCGLAHAAIDVSDGLLADLSHILNASHVGAILNKKDILITAEWHTSSENNFFEKAVCGGDDYVLCFTAPASARHLLEELALSENISIKKIGEITAKKGLYIDNILWEGVLGYQHF